MLNGFMVGLVVILSIYGVTLYPMRLLGTNRIPRRQPMLPNATSLSDDDSNSQTDGWVAVISRDIEILHKFMRFLVRSFSVENMLFIIETSGEAALRAANDGYEYELYIWLIYHLNCKFPS